MKVRNGFVSNSSSSSFVISLSNLTPKQVELIENHIEEGKKCGVDYCDVEDAWSISVDKYTISGNTLMDNFRMEQFFERVGISSKIVKWSD